MTCVILKIYYFYCLDELVKFQVDPEKFHVINELVDRPISLVVLGYSNAARAVLTNELVGGKPLFPVVTLTILLLSLAHSV